MEFKIGNMNHLMVKRKSDIGYMLVNEEDEEVLLHFNQAKIELYEGDEVDVFLYFDSKKRLAATMEEPIIKTGEVKFLKVINVVNELGIFLNNNIAKDVIVSLDDLPLDLNKWPKIDEEVLCKLKNTNTQLIGRLVSPEDAKNLLKPTTNLEKFSKVEAIVLKSGETGVNLITKQNHSIFVFYKHLRRDYHIGEVVEVNIVNIKDDGTYNGSFLENKENAVTSDTTIITDYLKNNNNYMPFTSKSDLEQIEKTFKMSKAAFKRALGNLYKNRIIEIKEDGTYLIK